MSIQSLTKQRSLYLNKLYFGPLNKVEAKGIKVALASLNKEIELKRDLFLDLKRL